MNITRAKVIVTAKAAGSEMEISTAPTPPPKKNRIRKVVKKSVQLKPHQSSDDDEEISSTTARTISETNSESREQITTIEEETSDYQRNSTSDSVVITQIESSSNERHHRCEYVVSETLISNMETTKYSSEVNEILDCINAGNYGVGEKPLRDLATIGYLIRNGTSIYEITNLYNRNEFPSLKLPESQSALVQLVEREGHAKLISEVLSEETNEEESVVAATVGFRAFLRMIELKHTTVEEVITHFVREDFLTQIWKTVQITEVRF